MMLLTASPVHAAPRNPPPEFEGDHVLPITETPLPCMSTGAENGLALGLYALALIFAVVAVHYRRSRRAMFLLSVFSVAVFGFAFRGCPCPVGALQNVAVAIQSLAVSTWEFCRSLGHVAREDGIFVVLRNAGTDFQQLLSGDGGATGGLISLTALGLFLLPLLVALFYGRVFCGGVCPLGAVQELVAIKPLTGKGNPAWLDDGLGILRYFYLGLAVLFATTGLWFLICRFDPFVPLFRLSGFFWIWVFSLGVLLLGMVWARPFCRFLCPYGALLGLCSSLAGKKVSVTPGNCSNCRLCEEICPVNAIRPPTNDPTPEEQTVGPLRLLVLLLAAPLIIGAFAVLGGTLLSHPLARLHPDVRLAERLLAEDAEVVETLGHYAETKAFQLTGQANSTVYRRAETVFARMRTGTTVFGAWCGLVVSVKLISLALRRRRTEYEVDPLRCVSCGRCFWYCPNGKDGRFLLDIQGPCRTGDTAAAEW